MNEAGDKLNAAYRALAREEPGAALDAAILAASRRAVAKPFAARRWAAPVSIAAVLVLAFGVTLHMQREQPGIESPDVASPPPAKPSLHVPDPPPARSAATQAPSPQAPAAQPQPAPRAKKLARAEEPMAARPPPAMMRERDPAFRDESPAIASERKDLAAQAAPAPELRKDAKLAAAAPMAAPPPAPGSPAAPSVPAPATKADANEARGTVQSRMKAESFRAPTPARAAAADARAPPDEITRELEAIAKLRAEGRNEDADKALEEFRRKHPAHRIADAMWERVKPR